MLSAFSDVPPPTFFHPLPAARMTNHANVAPAPLGSRQQCITHKTGWHLFILILACSVLVAFLIKRPPAHPEVAVGHNSGAGAETQQCAFEAQHALQIFLMPCTMLHDEFCDVSGLLCLLLDGGGTLHPPDLFGRACQTEAARPYLCRSQDFSTFRRIVSRFNTHSLLQKPKGQVGVGEGSWTRPRRCSSCRSTSGPK